MTDRPDLNLPSSNGGQADAMTFQTLDEGLLNIWADSQYINIPGPSDERSPVGFWNQTFEYSPNTAFISITSSKDDPGHFAGDPFLFLHAETNLSVSVVSPKNGDRLQDAFLLDMQSTRPVTHWLFYSLDGNTWTRLGTRLRGNQHHLTTGFLPTGSVVTLRVRSSDGFSTVENDIAGLILSTSPQVVITQPTGSRVLVPATLSALAGNSSDVTPASVTWSSSRDGALGTGESLSNVILSPGLHMLTCTVNLASGATASAQKQITVLADATIAADPSLTTNSLEVVSSTLPRGLLALNGTNRLNLTVFSSDDAAQAVLRVYAQAPGAQEQLLQEAFIELDGSAATRSVLYQPTSGGTHRIRAQLASADPDANPANNEFTWSVPVQPVGISATIEPTDAIAAGAQWRIGDGDWNPSGVVLAPGAVTSVPALINFKPVTGWRTPMPYSIDKDISENIAFTAQYQSDTGSVPYISPVRPFKYVGLQSFVLLSYYVLGQPKPIYNWYKDGALLAGSNTASLQFTAVQASNAGTYFLTASNAAGVVQGMPVTLVITNAGPTFAGWSQSWPGIGGATNDPDHDAIPNILEYALVLNPTVASQQGWPVPALLVTNAVPYLTLVYTRPKDAPELAYSFSTSSQLPIWDNKVPVQTLRTVDQGDTLSITVGIPANVARGAAGFIHFRVIQQ